MDASAEDASIVGTSVIDASAVDTSAVDTTAVDVESDTAREVLIPGSEGIRVALKLLELLQLAVEYV